jgi:hypothetical protein
MVLLALRRYALDDHILTDKIDNTTYWYHYDEIVLTFANPSKRPDRRGLLSRLSFSAP